MKIKNFLIILYTFFIIASCEENTPERIILGDKIKLTGSYENGIMTLKWNPPYVGNFSHYIVYRSYNSSSFLSIELINDFDSTSFIDYYTPLEDTISYLVAAYGSEGVLKSQTYTVVANLKVIHLNIDDVLIWKDRNWLYLIDNSNNLIYKYDYDQECMLDSLELSFSPGFCAIGDNGFGMELYIPGDSSLIRIYDATNLSYKDNIDAGIKISSVVTNNDGLIFTSASKKYSWPGIPLPLRSYSRENKAFIDGDGNQDFTRLWMIESTNEIIEISMDHTVEMNYYQFDETGTFTLHKVFDNSYVLDNNIFKISPDGNYFVTNTFGCLFDKNLNFIKMFAQSYSYFQAFCFDSNSENIYCGRTHTRKIEKYSLSGKTDPEKSYLTLGFPQFMIMLDNQILSLNSTLSEYPTFPVFPNKMPGIIIEKINL